jgi:hypothetical protein
VTVDNGDVVTFLAAPGGEWRPDQADWSGEAISVATSSTFGIVKAANNEPRFDHDPVTLACKGLLIEEGRTNSLLRSEEFDNAFWSKTNISVSQNSITAPSGAMTADVLQSVSSIASNVFSSVVATSTAMTYSIYTKKGNVATRFFLLRNSTTATNFQLGTINYDTGTISGTGWTIQALPDGWYRIAFTQSSGITSGDTLLAYCGMKGDVDTAGSTWAAWGAQLEAGSFATSYIPTTTAPLTRSADVCNITGGDFNNFYNQSEGTLFSTASTFPPNTNIRRIVFATDGTAANRAGFLFNNVGQPTTFVASSGGSLSALIASPVSSITAPVKIAGAYKVDDFAISANGSTVTNDTSGLVGVGINRLNIGSQNDTELINGHIAAIRYYKKRLPNAKLQALTV